MTTVVDIEDIRERFRDKRGIELLMASLMTQQQDPSVANVFLLGELIGLENALIANLVLNPGGNAAQSQTGTTTTSIQPNLLPLLFCFMRGGPDFESRFFRKSEEEAGPRKRG
jgi:hypothetical protein